MSAPDRELERTPAGIPVSLRPFFQEYILEDLDPEDHASQVIERTPAWGDLPELRWLFARYGRERLAQWVRDLGWRFLPRRRFKYWVCFFGLTDPQRGESMAPLATSHWEAVTPASRDLLLALGQIDPISTFYLAGGIGWAKGRLCSGVAQR